MFSNRLGKHTILTDVRLLKSERSLMYFVRKAILELKLTEDELDDLNDYHSTSYDDGDFLEPDELDKEYLQDNNFTESIIKSLPDYDHILIIIIDLGDEN